MKKLREIEKKWQVKWKEEKTFEGKSSKGKKVFMTVPYPYTSGPLHIGHGRTYTLADVWIRRKRLQGCNTFWPMGFHISGTPILAISKKIESGDAKTIKLFREYVGLYIKDKKEVAKIVESFKEPENVAKFFSEVISGDFDSLGFSIDWSRKFTTGDRDYSKFIEWQFLRLREMGLVTKGEHPVQYCVSCESAVGEDDIKDGDMLPTGMQSFTAVKFPFGDGYIIPATLRPETLFGLTNIWVNPDAKYIKAKVGDEIWYVSEEAAETLKYQNKKIVTLKTFKGKELVGKLAKSPVEDRKVPVLPASMVDPSTVTGTVYSVPAHSPDDCMALRDMQNDGALAKRYGIDSDIIRSIKPISIIKVKGFGEFPAQELCNNMKIEDQKEREKLKQATKKIYKEEFYSGVLKSCGPFTGRKVSGMKDDMKDWLKEKGSAFDFYVSETPDLVCRCGGKVVIKVMDDQWFLDYGNPEWKKKAKECIAKMKILPEGYRKMFEYTADWLHERACARKRGLGTKLPWDKGWVIESLSDSTIYPAFYTIVKGIRETGTPLKSLTPGFFDYVFFGKGTPEKDVSETADALRKEFDYWYPVDERHTAVAHISNHLIFYIFNHAALFPKSKWPKSITLNELLIKEGAKMSKSKGNVVPLVEISRECSADLYRLFVVYAADLDAVVDWRDSSVAAMQKRLLRFCGLCYDIISKRDEAGQSGANGWLISRFSRAVADSDAFLSEFRFREYVQRAFFDVLNDISYYMRRSGGKPDYPLLYSLLSGWLRLLSPVVPHICEELWQTMGEPGCISNSVWPKADVSKISESVEKSEEIVKGALDDILNVISISGISPKKATVFVSKGWKYGLWEVLSSAEKGKDIMAKAMKEPAFREHGKETAKLVQRFMKNPGKFEEPLPKSVEMSSLEGALPFFESELSCGVEIIDGEKSSHPKAAQAEPGKPGILIE